MNRNIYDAIDAQYEKKRKSAYDALEIRRQELYSRIPFLEEIERDIQRNYLKYNRHILSGSVGGAAVELLSEIDRLQKEKGSLMEEAGYPRDYLDIQYSCPACKDTGYSEGADGPGRCACFKQLLINQLYDQSNLALTSTQNFKSFNADFYPDTVDESRYGIPLSPRENILKIRERCCRYIENFQSVEERNLFFTGRAGTGKTFMANCVAHELMVRGVTVLYQTAPVLFNLISEHRSRAFREDEYDEAAYQSIFDVELLIIDDLGTESQSPARYAEFLTILNTRQIRNLSRPCKTLISTNIGIKELYEFYDERNASRIIGGFDIFRFAGDDIRTLRKLGNR